MPTLFERIIAGEIPSYKVWEDDKHFAFLTIEPIQPGHTLVIPKKPAHHLFDMTDSEYLDLMHAAKHVAKHIQSRTRCEKVGVIVEGYGVKDHVHIHLVPLTGGGQLDFAQAKKASPEELQKMQDILTRGV